MDLWRGRLSVRKASVLARWLPDGAMTHAAAGSDASWTATEHLLAALIDVGQVGNWQRGGDSNTPKPQRWPRPGDATQKGRAESAIETRARRFTARRAAQPETEVSDGG